MAKRVTDFTVAVADEALEDLQERLLRTRWPDSVEDPEGIFGMDMETLRDLRNYWLDIFDWRRVELDLNRFPNYLFEYEEGVIHFLHVKGTGECRIPLLLTHGWPGSAFDALKIIPLLTDPANFGLDAADSFDIVAPSLPGFGFSSPSSRPGMNSFAIAKVWADLMTELGYKEFVVQGGDVGAGVSTALALLYPERVKALHLSFIPATYQPYLQAGETLTSEENEFLQEKERWFQENGAYAHVQRSEPQTLAMALNDSPMGLAAWILDKMRRWSDCDGEVEKRFRKREILAGITLYWVTQTIGSSCRLYAEGWRAPLHLKEGERVLPPCAIAQFPKEIFFPPRSWVERGYQVERWTKMTAGGHFAAMEEPVLLANDIREFCRRFRNC